MARLQIAKSPIEVRVVALADDVADKIYEGKQVTGRPSGSVLELMAPFRKLKPGNENVDVLILEPAYLDPRTKNEENLSRELPTRGDSSEKLMRIRTLKSFFTRAFYQGTAHATAD